MSEKLHYSKNPITEAIIDLRVDIEAGFGVKDLKSICSQLEPDYPTVEKMFLLSGEFQFQVSSPDSPQGDVSQANADHQHIGYRLLSRDKHLILQARLDGFAFVVLKPYNNWEEFRDEARRLWSVYRNLVPITSIKRAAVRYINRFDIPATAKIELKDYLKTFPEVSSEYSYPDISGFLVQLQVPQPDVEGMLLLTQTLLPAATPEFASILLDIDLFVEKYSDAWIPEQEEEAWDLLERLRVRKNKIFKGSITPKMEDLIL